MNEQLRVLHLEDNESDGELVARALVKAGIEADITRVEHRAAFLAALGQHRFDLVLSDFSLPDFDGLSALTAFRQVDRLTPFIFVSGTIGEERAVQALRDGATDYILKDRLSRLPSALARSLEERREKQAREIAEERIREQASLLDEAREAIVVMDLERRVTYWNGGAEQMYGWSADEAKAGVADGRFQASAQAELDRAWDAVLATGCWDGVFTQRTREGREIVVDAHWTCLRHDDGSPRAILCIGSDVTEARRMEAQLLQAERLETVGMIAGGVAHDLNNVLAPILIGISSLRRRVTDDTGQRLLTTMETGVQRGADIVRQVLTFARGARDHPGRIDPTAALHGIEKLVVAALPKNVRLTIRLAPDLWQVRGDATQLQQVLLNLCINARDAMPAGGSLLLEADNVVRGESPSGPFVVIRVVDTGQGMTDEVRAKIFEPFYTTKAQGTGIGLATVAAIVKRHGGWIEVDSTVGEGTEFRVFLPRHPAEAARGRLLLVVDERSVRPILEETLEAYGYRVEGAETAQEALAVHGKRSAEVAAVIANLALPGLGPELVRALTRQNPDAKVIDTGGENTIAQATLPRPYTPDVLLETVRRVLEGS